MTDFHFTPESVVVPAGEEVALTVVNSGTVKHQFIVFKLGKDAGSAFDAQDQENIYWQVEAEPGETKTLAFPAPAEPGEYYITCGVVGHLEAGMVGKLIVRAP
ncbi:MAG: cupredoxin domain-containing protein [Anaerolineales bacterium]